VKPYPLPFTEVANGMELHINGITKESKKVKQTTVKAKTSSITSVDFMLTSLKLEKHQNQNSPL